jgi:biotin carboxyl carrier protein
MNPETGLPEVDEEKCTSCGACVKACPRNIIELRKKGPKGRRVFVSCVNKDKGPVAMKACKAACIGCGKCEKECKFEAITIANNVCYIDHEKCRICRKCVAVCPTGAIHDVNFPTPAPQPKPKEEAPKAEAPKAAPAPKAAAPKAAEAPAAGYKVTSPLPGSIIKVLVSEGQDVKKGDTLLTLESMKMENAVMADRDGKVTKIAVTAGQNVMQDDLLIVLG